MNEKERAPRNRTIEVSESEMGVYSNNLMQLKGAAALAPILDKTIWGDVFEVLPLLPEGFADLIFADPPYNLTKIFNENSFRRMRDEDYEAWLESWLPQMKRLLKPHGSLYICGDWKSSAAIYNVARKYFHIQNRITFEREKGRGAKSNWKNCSEDIWFCTVSEDYYFDVEAVKLKKKVIAPYRTEDGKPKDWEASGSGNYRVTHPSNLWTDITIPFWSMPENTDHPTQKPEKLAAKIILASSAPGDVVFDPFLGSGTTSVVAKKLGRKYVGVEKEELYCCLAEKRLKMAESDASIQGYNGGVFWERNTLAEQDEKKNGKLSAGANLQSNLFSF